MELDEVVLYHDDSGNSAVMSERVSGLASSIYREFERLIEKYDEDVVKELMPLVVAVLENLETACGVSQEREVELELLKEDNEQLVTQYEREKALRKHAEERYMVMEDSQEGEKKELQIRVISLESQARQLETKTKNYADQISRFEEREAELKKEYNALHQRHTEMIHSYMEHLERTKHQHGPATEPSESGPIKTRKERPISIGLYQLPGPDGVTPDPHRQPEDAAEPWRFNNLSHPRSNTSLKLAQLFPVIVENENSPQNPKCAEEQDELSSTSRGSKSGSPSKSPAPKSSSSSQGPASNLRGGASTQVSSDVTMEAVATPNQEREALDRLNSNLDGKSGKPDGNKDITNIQKTQDSSSSLNDEVFSDGANELEKSAVQAIIESTPELDMELEGLKATSTPTKSGVENLAFNRNTDSLFEELSSAGNDLVGDVDEGADLLGMGREVEHLIQENAQLLETKNALNVVKNDLIAQLDDLVCEKEVLQGELTAVSQAKSKLEQKNKELEEELKKLRTELEETKRKVKNDNEDDSDVPTAQRKRFTRVEMARVLMERNQYKERLMELQEAVRWTEMIRASKENPTLPEKKKSSLWQFFSRLFSSSGGAAKKPSTEAPVNVKYNAPTSQVQPSVKKKSSALQQLPSDKSKAFDFLNEEAPAENVVSRREQKRAQYQQVKAHVQKEDGRVQAYGWSLPKKYKANGGQAEGKVKNLPVPVFLRPLDEKDASMKLWCAAGVNLSGGRTRDGGSIVGASVFYSDPPASDNPRKKTQSNLDQLDQELKEQQKELRQQEDLSSLVWICTSTQASTKAVVIDANQPGNILESFTVCSSHVLCIASVPGARETDYPAGEEVCVNSGPSKDPSSCASPTPGEEGLLGGITVLGCTAEGSAAPQSPVKTNGESRPEEATEAVEGSPTAEDRRGSLRGVYTEHIFTDPLGADGTHGSGDVKDGCEQGAEEEQDLSREEAQKMSSVQPTMWLGAQNGCIYVHSSVAQRKRCLHSVKLKDSVLGIVHVKGRVLVGLSDGTIAIFHRGADGQWDMTNYHLITLGRPHQSIRCMSVVHDKVWCGSRNKIYVVQPRAMNIEKCFDAHPRKDSQVRLMAWDGDGIWVSIRLDSTLRLFHAHTHQHLQDVDIEPYVSKMLGTGKLGFSFVRITALTISCQRLWIGTGNGVIISIPLTDTNKTLKGSGSSPGSVVRVYSDESGDKVHAGTFVPYCSMAHAQLCFHGHRDAVKFFTAVPGQAIPSWSGAEAGDKPQDPSAQEGGRSTLVMSGGEGYIDFRMGDEEGEGGEGEEPMVKLQPKAERSHLIVWQVLHNSQ
ncbi:C-Jun-amino-terminal kinase-interacting protein 4 isoform X2 [Periophthalmus magnuspinnatus]|uniref:C-Jun-amino-terminal kinase-interacting protein 4 isoform X2 n=1 Tax=Periophthalmus magnuspinnatus TaxID=409849 RepID=UPI00243676AE|nr:C-Jun-amino-terminal kinase-interacting protein 4 isoform X2 [Periophthalmus magnuspinnatus]